MLTEIKQDAIGDVLVVGPQGKLDGNGAKNLEQVLQKAMEEGASRILFDFTGLAYISSSGLRVILATAKRVRNESGKVALCELNDNIQKVFEMSGFSSILNIEDSREAALSEFF